jgi:hypothetical protein
MQKTKPANAFIARGYTISGRLFFLLRLLRLDALATALRAVGRAARAFGLALPVLLVFFSHHLDDPCDARASASVSFSFTRPSFGRRLHARASRLQWPLAMANTNARTKRGAKKSLAKKATRGGRKTAAKRSGPARAATTSAAKKPAVRKTAARARTARARAGA